MRVTTQMSNELARQAKIPTNSTTLLNYINDSSENTLLDVLDKSGGGTVNTAQKSSYGKLEKAADQLLQQAEVFAADESVFARARESGSNQEICDSAAALVESFNRTVKALKSTTNPLNDYYRQMLKEAAQENGEALDRIGITLSGDGTAALDRDRLRAADADSLKLALGASGTFSEKIAFLASRISDNARANEQSLSSRYGSNGDLYSALSSKYDVWG